jgi:hypothetical protein
MIHLLIPAITEEGLLYRRPRDWKADGEAFWEQMDNVTVMLEGLVESELAETTAKKPPGQCFAHGH